MQIVKFQFYRQPIFDCWFYSEQKKNENSKLILPPCPRNWTELNELQQCWQFIRMFSSHDFQNFISNASCDGNRFRKKNCSFTNLSFMESPAYFIGPTKICKINLIFPLKYLALFITVFNMQKLKNLSYTHLNLLLLLLLLFQVLAYTYSLCFFRRKILVLNWVIQQTDLFLWKAPSLCFRRKIVFDSCNWIGQNQRTQ